MTAVSPNKPRRRGGKPPLLPEHLLAKLWRAREGRSLRTVDGRKVTVVYAGRPAPGHGPDFQDAVLEMDNRRSTGDVELHRVPSDWHAHGTARTPPTMASCCTSWRASRSARAPTCPSPSCARPARDSRPPRPRSPSSWSSSPEQARRSCRHALVRSGMARFEERAASAAQRATEAGAEQALHEAVFDALGYAENRAPFLRLARAAPYRELRGLALAHPPDAQDERESRLARHLLDIADLAGNGQEPPWRTSGVRPANHPRRRILGAAFLIARTADDGLLAACSIACAAGPSALEQLLTVTGGGGTLIGAGRAREAAVNAVLPVIAAQVMIEAQAGMSDAAAEAYRLFPSLPDNSVTREARRLAGAQGMRLSACEQLGLMRLYRRGIAGI